MGELREVIHASYTTRRDVINQTKKSVTVIVFYTAQDLKRVQNILRELKLTDRENIVLIDARSDNKPSASKA
jgi:ATP-dependent RNA circularization protein (DNA/RNA ligase family)